MATLSTGLSACGGSGDGPTSAGPSVAAVTVTPSSATIFVGGSTQLTAVAIDASGSVLANRTITWQSSNQAVASVNASGTVTGVAAGGPVTITASSEGKSASAAITVTPSLFTIVFQTGSGSSREIWRVDTDASDLVRLTTNSLADYVPALSPTGTRIVFIRDGSITTMNRDGSGVATLLSASNATEPVYSPDGSRIAYANLAGGGLFPVGDIRVIDATTGAALVTLASTSNDERHPSWSPNGATVYYSRDPDPSTLLEIYSVPSGGGTATRLTTTPAFSERNPEVSPFGTRLSYTDNSNVFLVNADGTGTPLQLTTYGSTGTPFASNPSWCPDGRIVFVEVGSGGDDIWIMNADGSGKTRLTNTPTVVKGSPSCGRKP